MKILLSYIKYLGNSLLRNVYWMYRLMNAEIGKKPILSFPIKVEGRGKISIDDFANIQKRVEIGVGEKGNLKIGNNCRLEENSTLLLNSNNSLIIGSGFKLGAGARMYVQSNWQFGNDVKIETYCAIFAREPNSFGQLKIGNGSHIGDHTIIDLVNDVTLGDEVALGPNCTLYTHDHDYGNNEVAAWKGGLVSKPIMIEDGAWVGSGVTILPGVTIGKRAIVAAGSVVTRNIGAETIWGGIPAKLIKTIS